MSIAMQESSVFFIENSEKIVYFEKFNTNIIS